MNARCPKCNSVTFSVNNGKTNIIGNVKKTCLHCRHTWFGVSDKRLKQIQQSWLPQVLKEMLEG